MRLGEQIAVLDGLSTIDPSDGANYTGGSDYSPGLPLITSSSGLAAALKRAVRINPPAAAAVVKQASAILKRVPPMIPSSYSTTGGINASNGANYSGGSNYPENQAIPLMTSSIGLSGMPLTDTISQMTTLELQQLLRAAGVVKLPLSGVWNAASVKAMQAFDPSYDISKQIVPYNNGKSVMVTQKFLREIAGEVGKINHLEGLSGMSAVDQDLMQESNVISVQKVINASNGGNYSGGSSYPENQAIPLMTSSIGLAGFAAALKRASKINPPAAAAIVKATSATLKRIPPMIPSSYSTTGGINASNGANYSGGSNYPEEQAIPLMTSSIGLSGLGVIDPSVGVNYGGGSNYPDSGKWPLLPSSSGLVGLAAVTNAADKFTAAQRKKVAAAVTSSLVENAQNKLAAVYVSLMRVVNDSKETAQNRLTAKQLANALQTAAAADPKLAAWKIKATALWRKWQAEH